jgi:hypothetical protein
MANNEQFLTITGVWTLDGRLDLQPSYVTQSSEGASGGEVGSAERLLIVELIDDQGEIIARQPITVSRLCSYPEASTPPLLVADKILFPEETRTLRFFRADTDTVIHEIARPESRPEIRLNWDPPGELDEPFARRSVISWTAEHPEEERRTEEERPLQFLVFYSHSDGESWQPVTLPLEDSELELDFDQLPGGESCRVKVLATDGVNTSEAESRAFSIPEKGVRATILTPENGASVSAREAVWLHGQGYHLEELRPELEDLTWSSSIDGELGRGSTVEVRLSEGQHAIMLRAGEDTAQISLSATRVGGVVF